MGIFMISLYAWRCRACVMPYEKCAAGLMAISRDFRDTVVLADRDPPIA